MGGSHNKLRLTWQLISLRDLTWLCGFFRGYRDPRQPAGIQEPFWIPAVLYPGCRRRRRRRKPGYKTTGIQTIEFAVIILYRIVNYQKMLKLFSLQNCILMAKNKLSKLHVCCVFQPVNNCFAGCTLVEIYLIKFHFFSIKCEKRSKKCRDIFSGCLPVFKQYS